MDAARQKLIERARELNISTFPADEMQNRIHEVCSEYLIEAKVDVDRLLRHDDWRVRQSALDIVAWGVGATDGVETSIELLTHDPDEDVRAFASFALCEAARGTPKQNRVNEVFKRVAESDESDYVRDSVSRYLLKLSQHRPK
jgi:HEAT repeat protein